MSALLTLHRVVTAEGNPRPLALVRILFGMALLLKPLALLTRWEALLNPAAARIPYFSFYSIPAVEQEGTRLLLIGCMIAVWCSVALAVLAGWHTRLGTALSTLLLAGTLLADQQFYSNHLYLMTLVGFLLSMSDCGAAFSLDSRRHGETFAVPLWPASLLRALLTIVYAFAVMTKMNPIYLTGHVMARSMPWLPAGATALIIAVSLAGAGAEGFLAWALWSRKWRAWAYPVGLLLHAGMVLGVAGTPEVHLEIFIFFLVTVSLYLLFLPADMGLRVVRYAPQSALGRQLVPWLQRLDWFGVHRLEPAERGEGLLLAHADTAVSGWDALQQVMEALPATCWAAPILRFRLVRQIAAQRRWDDGKEA